MGAARLVTSLTIIRFGGDSERLGTNVRFRTDLATPAIGVAMHQNDTIATLVTADHDAVANARERHALLAEARWEIRRQHAAEAVRRLRIHRHGVAVVVQRLGG
jgi:hypothetical protein